VAYDSGGIDFPPRVQCAAMGDANCHPHSCLGFPIALVFSWAFEITPEGIVRESEVVADQSITHHTGNPRFQALYKKMNFPP